MFKKSLFIIFAVTLTSGLWAEAPHLSLPLAKVEEEGLKTSSKYLASQAEAESAQFRASGQFATLLPRVAFEGSYRHVSEVPEFAPVPGVPPVQFGDHKNYSYGPALYWTVFNSGGLYNRWKAEDAASRAKSLESDAVKRRLLLETRVDYFQVQLSLEQVRLLADSLRLAIEQYKDIDVKFRAGTLSKIDSLSAHQEVLNRRRELKQAQADLAGSLRNLFALTGLGHETDPTFPMAEGLDVSKLDKGEPTLYLSLDAMSASHKNLLLPANTGPDTSHPSIQALAESAEAARRTSVAVRSGHGPTIQFLAKATRDYPNGPVLESFNQQTVGVTANWPLFEGGRVLDETKAQRRQAESLEKRKDQASTDLVRDWEKAQDQFKSLQLQQEINLQSVKETEELAKLVYDSYRAGRSSYLEVETANFNALQAKVYAARTEVQTLIQLAILDSLSKR